MTFNAARIDDMLRCYSAKEIEVERAAAEKLGQHPLPWAISAARHRGECLAWVMHDSFFIWERPLTNTLAELRQYMVGGNYGLAEEGVRDWPSLRSYTITRAVGFLCRQEYPPCPALLPAEHETTWWMYMAIIHECYRQLGADLQLGK